MSNLSNVRIDLGMNGMGTETFNDLKSTDTVAKLKQKLTDRIGKTNVVGIKLLLGQVLSEDSKTLGEVGVRSRSILGAGIRLRGGTEGEGEISSQLANKLGITLSTKKCSICYDDEGHKRIGFPECGGKCQFCRICIKNQYNKCIFSSNETQVVCPVGSECNNAKWKTTDLLQILKLTEEEETKCYRQLNQNYISRTPNMTSCPGCEHVVYKEGIDHNRVRCPRNKCPLKKDWCFSCEREWKGTTSNYKICGNENCSDSKIANVASQLENTQLKKVDHADKVPVTRLCVGCTTTVTWNSNCKHMTCICSHQFCIICVKKWKGCNCNKSRCKNDNNVCNGDNKCSIVQPDYQINKLKQYI